MTPCELVKRAVAAHHMRSFLAGDRKGAVSAMVSSQHGWSAGDGWGQVGPKGVGLFRGLADGRDPRRARVFVTWAEVAAAIQRGARPDLVADFDAAWALWTAWCKAGGYGGHPWPPDDDPAAEAAAIAHQQAYSVATRAMDAATKAIIDAGYAADAPAGPVQGDLLELLGGAA